MKAQELSVLGLSVLGILSLLAAQQVLQGAGLAHPEVWCPPTAWPSLLAAAVQPRGPGGEGATGSHSHIHPGVCAHGALPSIFGDLSLSPASPRCLPKSCIIRVISRAVTVYEGRG